MCAVCVEGFSFKKFFLGLLDCAGGKPSVCYPGIFSGQKSFCLVLPFLFNYFDFFNTYHNKIGALSFIIAILLGLIFIYKADIVFSAKKSGCDRKIDEHELMDIYKSYICNFHFVT